VLGANGSRTIEADDLFVDLFTTALEPDEIITSVAIQVPPSGSAAAYEMFRHPASGYAVVGVAAVVNTNSDGVVDAARIAVTGATSKATRASAAEQALVGKKLSAEAITAAAKVAADGLELNGDHFASAEYRGHLISVLTGRALAKVAAAG
jgi:carbon-monoxide dehydrogenase medium subunit